MTHKQSSLSPEAPVAFDMVRRKPSPCVAGLISGISGYRETKSGRYRQRETADLCVPLIISLGSPFRIALGRDPGHGDRQPSFAAGLFPGPVYIESDGAAECVQVDFTPLGAYRFFGRAVAELAARMVDIGDVLGASGRRLRQRLGETASWQRRFDILEDFIARRAEYRISREIDFAYRALARAGGDIKVSHLATDIGWSRKHFVHRFAAEIGVGPKTVARMMRFHRACALALVASHRTWAGIAAEAGFSDQAHLAREFGALAGESPTVWARRMALTDGRLLRDVDAFDYR